MPRWIDAVLPSSVSPFSTFTLCLSDELLRKTMLIVPACALTTFWLNRRPDTGALIFTMLGATVVAVVLAPVAVVVPALTTLAGFEVFDFDPDAALLPQPAAAAATTITSPDTRTLRIR